MFNQERFQCRCLQLKITLHSRQYPPNLQQSLNGSPQLLKIATSHSAGEKRSEMEKFNIQSNYKPGIQDQQGGTAPFSLN